MTGGHGTDVDGWLTDLVKDEPVLAASIAAAAIGSTTTALVTHDVITKVQASALSQTVLPLATAGVLLLLGILIRSVVSPAAKFVDRLEAAVQARLSSLPVLPAQHAAAISVSDSGVTFPPATTTAPAQVVLPTTTAPAPLVLPAAAPAAVLPTPAI